MAWRVVWMRGPKETDLPLKLLVNLWVEAGSEAHLDAIVSEAQGMAHKALQS